MFFKRFWLGMSVIVLIFGMTVLGCASMAAKINYYNLGDVSESNCALIEVSPVHGIWDSEKRRVAGDYSFSNFLKIDGQGDDKLWQPPPKGELDLGNKTIVRVTPGVHTFTLTFYYDKEYEVPCNITYDCKAGKGYKFTFLVEEAANWAAAGLFTMDGSKVKFGIGSSTIYIDEAAVNEKGNFGGFASEFSTVASKKEAFNFHPDWNPNDRGRLVKR